MNPAWLAAKAQALLAARKRAQPQNLPRDFGERMAQGAKEAAELYASRPKIDEPRGSAPWVAAWEDSVRRRYAAREQARNRYSRVGVDTAKGPDRTCIYWLGADGVYALDSAIFRLSGNRIAGFIIDDPHNEEPMSDDTYKSTTHGPIKLSFTGRRLLANLRDAIVGAIARGAYTNERNDVAHARGELAKYMSALEGKQPNNENEAAAQAVLADVRNVLGLKTGEHVTTKAHDLKARVEDLEANERRGYEAAWNAVVSALHRLVPNWLNGPECGKDRAVIAIEGIVAEKLRLRAQLEEMKRLHAEALEEASRAERRAESAEERLHGIRAREEAATRALRQQLEAAQKAVTDVLNARPPTVMMQAPAPREVTAAQATAVWERLRVAVVNSYGTIGFGYGEVRTILEDAFNGK